MTGRLLLPICPKPFDETQRSRWTFTKTSTMEAGKMKYDLIVVGAGPAGLMAARTAARDGLKVLLLEQRKKICQVKRFCSQLIRVGGSGFSSDKKPTDREIKPVTVTFEINYGRHTLRLNNLEDDVTVDYRGPLRSYYNEIFISPSGYSFDRLESNEQFYGFQIDKDELLAGMLEECTGAGAEVREGTRCSDIEDHSRGVNIRLNGHGGEETLAAGRIILADGAFSSLTGKLGFNEERPDLGPTIKFLAYILDRVDSPFPESRHLQMCVPSLFPGQVPLALWAHDTFQICMATPIFTKIKLSDLLDRFMKESPFASWFASSKVVDRLGCNMALRTPLWEPAKGNVICCGDNAAFAEAAIKGALGCGYSGAKASKIALEGKEGNAHYNNYWQHAFYFHSPQYLGSGKKIFPPARTLNDSEIDTLFKWMHDNHLWGLPGDVLLDNLEQFKKELPEISEKLLP